MARSEAEQIVQDTTNVAVMQRMMTAEMVERYIGGPNTYAELRSRVAACVWRIWSSKVTHQWTLEKWRMVTPSMMR